MGDKTGIEWTDATWNPTVGCSVISPGCKHCYAMKHAARLERMGSPIYAGLTKPSKAGPVWSGKLWGNSAKAFEAPLHWKKPRRIFVNSMSDLFHEDMPVGLIDQAFAIMAVCPQHTFQILTKRPERMKLYMLDGQSAARRISNIAKGTLIHWPLPNVWLGVSVEDQHHADARIPLLLETPATKRFLSCEPLLGPVDLTAIEARDRDECYTQATARGRLNALSGWCYGEDMVNGAWEDWLAPDQGAHGWSTPRHRHIDWVIVGGESGQNARPMHPHWARSLRDQCETASVPFFFKQWGEWAPALMPDPDRPGYQRWHPPGPRKRGFNVAIVSGEHVNQCGKKAAGRELDGRTWEEFPR